MMKMFFRPASPFVRKVRVMAMETGLVDQIELVPLATFEEMVEQVTPHNPLGKIPTLLLEDGSALYDSPVICEYLDTLHDGEKLFPAQGPARWTALRQQALGDGLGDAVFIAAFEANRPEEHQLAAPVEAQMVKIKAALKTLDAQVNDLTGPLTIGQIAVGTGLGYLFFHFPDLGWEADCPALAKWRDKFNARESMKETFFAKP
jgi:glutathione S-transferase